MHYVYIVDTVFLAVTCLWAWEHWLWYVSLSVSVCGPVAICYLWLLSVTWRSMGYRRPRKTAILPPPKVVWRPLISPIFPPAPGCRPGWSAHTAPSLCRPLVEWLSWHTLLYVYYVLGHSYTTFDELCSSHMQSVRCQIVFLHILFWN